MKIANAGGDQPGDGNQPGSGEASSPGEKDPGKDPSSGTNTTVSAPDKAVIKSAKSKKAGTVTIKMKSPKADGYEVACALSKKKLSKVKKYKTFTKTKFNVTKLKKGKTYFIKIRAFKKDAAGKRTYGKWSKVKKVKVKK